MHAPTAAQLLDAWESGLARSPISRSLILLASACPESRVDELAAFPVGVRDARLMELRRMLFGSDLSMIALCPACGVRLESSLRVEDFWPQRDPSSATSLTCAVDGFRMTFRRAASDDVMAVASDANGASARFALLARCVTEIVDEHGKEADVASVPASVLAAVERQMALADPEADVHLGLACPACAHRWQPIFDIGTFLWEEVNAWARRTLREVHALAQAYGWRESDVLGLSPTRRTIYLELAGQ